MLPFPSEGVGSRGTQLYAHCSLFHRNLKLHSIVWCVEQSPTLAHCQHCHTTYDIAFEHRCIVLSICQQCEREIVWSTNLPTHRCWQVKRSCPECEEDGASKLPR